MTRLFTLLFCCLFSFQLTAQDRFKVQRCADIDRRVPILNIHVDEKKNKWVADGQGLFLAQSPAFAQTVDIPRDQWSLLSVKNGNQELSFAKAELQQAMGDAFSGISCGHYDVRKKELWIGTKNNGLFHFKTNPSLSLISNLTSSNSKLRSDRIQSVFLSASGELLVGTDDGLFQKRGGKDALIGKFFNVEDVAMQGSDIWLVGDGEVLEVEGRKDVYSFSVKPGMVEGDVVDIEFDSKGNLWIASEIVCRYNFNTEEFDVFGPADGFTSQFVEYIAIDGDDAAWVGTRDKGVYFIGSASTMGAQLIVEKKLGCDADAKDAALTVRATGGEPPYEYKWTGGLSGNSPSNLGPGTYKVTITDSEGQTVAAETTLEDPRISLDVSMKQQATFGGTADGAAEVKASGGGGFFNYKWDNGESEAVAKKLKAGKHSVTITDKNGCKVTGEVEITEGLAPLVVELEQTADIKCSSEAQAALKANVKGGQPPYQFKWQNSQSISETADGLKAGSYEVVITDAAGNTTNNTFTIEEPRPLQVKVTADAPASTNNADGKASLRSQGGTGTLSFQWDNGETTDTPEKLTGGTHTVTVTDEAGCSVEATVEITEDILPLAIELELTAEVVCAGDNNAALQVAVTGGKGPFEYQWSAADASGETAGNLAAGKYDITVTDAAGSTATTTIEIPDAPGLSAKVQVDQAASTDNADGKATAKAEGGAGNYIYRWDTGENNVTATQLAAGQHSVTVLDVKDCSTVVEFEVGEDILPLAVELEVTDQINCNGEGGAGIQASVSGGKGPFNYNWSAAEVTGEKITNQKAGSYSLTVTDAAGNESSAEINVEEPDKLEATIFPSKPATTDNADGKARVKVVGGGGKYTYKWDTGETEVEATQLAAGTHSVTVTDANGCVATATAEITEDILPFSADIDITQRIQCAGENTAILTAVTNGGKGPFEYRWSAGGASGEIASNLSAGTYELTVVDAMGTEATSGLELKEPEPLEASITPTSPANTDQADGQATVKVTGGSGEYSYQWDTGETGEAATQLAAGKHLVTITDAAGCSTTASVDIGEDILPLAVSIDLTQNISCAGDNNGIVTAAVSGGKGPFIYKWSIDGSRTERAENLRAGIYKLTVTDAAGNKV
ncbi:MAG: SprB repeat-containing protein, partial [Bacteroidota bacterium]